MSLIRNNVGNKWKKIIRLLTQCNIYAIIQSKHENLAKLSPEEILEKRTISNETVKWIMLIITSVADPDPGLGAFLTPGSGIRDGRKSASGSGIRDEQPGSYFLELRNHFFAFFGVKILKFFDEDLGSGDGDSSDPGSGMGKSRIRDPG